METVEPKYLMDETSFYWNPFCPDNQFDVMPMPESNPDVAGVCLVPVRIYRNGKRVAPDDGMPDDIRMNARRIV